MEANLETIDLSCSKLKKLEKPDDAQTKVKVLIIDENDLDKLENVHLYSSLEKLSAAKNRLPRMYYVRTLHYLHTLNLSHNYIHSIEGLKELTNLKYLCLAGNSIKNIEHLETNVNLEHLDLSDNKISQISDISVLKSLKDLLLHGNKIDTLRLCDRYLPVTLTTLTLSSNNICDLNEISYLVHLTSLQNISINNNPCVTMNGDHIFDYRPFIINWCMSLKNIDGFAVNPIESLRAEWLYSQGKGRQFHIGEHKELVQYLTTVCHLSGETLETEDERKLRIILSKAQHHQLQLKHELETGVPSTPSPTSHRRFYGRKNSPRLHRPRSGGLRTKSPESTPMISSCYSPASSASGDAPALMSQSLDPILLHRSTGYNLMSSSVLGSLPGSANTLVSERDCSEGGFVEVTSCPLQAATRLVPVPESLMSPDNRPMKSLLDRASSPKSAPEAKSVQKIVISNKHNVTRTFNKNSVKNVEKKKSVPNTQRNTSETPNKSKESKLEKAKDDLNSQKSQTKITNDDVIEDTRKKNEAAIRIQKIWRGFLVRNRNKQTLKLLKNIQAERTRQYILKLSSDMESTKAALESERKIQVLQMQAINALWKKITALEPIIKENKVQLENPDVVRDLTTTCSLLQEQVQQLYGSMQDVVKCMSTFCQVPSGSLLCQKQIETQTEIVAVHTPLGDASRNFPFQKNPRPSSLPLPLSRSKLSRSVQENDFNENVSNTSQETLDHHKDIDNSMVVCAENHTIAKK